MFVLFLISCLQFLGSLYGKPLDVDGFIRFLPEKDKQKLTIFFEELVTTEVIFYSLLGEKPVSSVCYFAKPSEKWSLLYPSLHYRNRQLKSGWEVWKKYAVLLNNASERFLLVSHQEGSIELLSLINKPFFLKAVEKHLISFQEAFGTEMTPESFLEEFKKQGFYLLKEHQDLIGILYGYGMHNAKLFKRYCHLLIPCKGIEYPLAKSAKDDQELRILEQQLSPSFEYHEGIDRVAAVSFRCDHSFSGSRVLLMHYKKIRKDLSHRLKRESALEIFLEEWNSSL